MTTPTPDQAPRLEVPPAPHPAAAWASYVLGQHGLATVLLVALLVFLGWAFVAGARFAAPLMLRSVEAQERNARAAEANVALLRDARKSSAEEHEAIRVLASDARTEAHVARVLIERVAGAGGGGGYHRTPVDR
jgi:hypothetical protein